MRLKAAASDRSISDLVSEAVRLSLAEDADDLAAFEKRSKERSLKFENVVRVLPVSFLTRKLPAPPKGSTGWFA